jgi:hypothetical protein
MIMALFMAAAPAIGARADGGQELQLVRSRFECATVITPSWTV